MINNNKSSSLINLLVQGIQGNSISQLEKVLRHGNPTMVESTVKELPLELVIPFLNLLVQKCEEFQNRSSMLSIWISCILKSHTSFIMSQNVEDQNHPVKRLKLFLRSRGSLLNQFSRLYGRIGLIIESNPKEKSMNKNDSETLFIDEDMDEENCEDILINEDGKLNKKRNKNGTKKKKKTIYTNSSKI